MTLREYQKKRRFDVTGEPKGKVGRSTANARRLRFVVQKHQASHLHYDFRLEWDGVLLSWAVPKGPSIDPGEKRLAMAVEDHPLEYADFEGVIPAGEYGGGTVMVWDRGTYVPKTANVGEARRKGRIDFTINGQKLKGDWLLVRTGAQDSRSWLLIKRRDEKATTESLLEAKPRSVKSKRLMAEIAFDEGGDVDRAARADPVHAIRELIRSPRTRTRRPRAKPTVWHSSRTKAHSNPRSHPPNRG